MACAANGQPVSCNVAGWLAGLPAMQLCLWLMAVNGSQPSLWPVAGWLQYNIEMTAAN